MNVSVGSLALVPAQLEPLFGTTVSVVLFLAGAGLIVAEAFAPGTHFFVLGVALLVAGLVGFLIPPGLGVLAPLILAAAVLATTAVTLWGYRKIDFSAPGRGQSLSSSSLQGQFGTVTERVTTSAGQVKLEDGGFNPYYEARSVGGEIAEGTEVLVVDPGGGNVLKVEAAATTDDDIDRALERDREENTSVEPDAESEHA
ncbi:NfeD family protein [Haloarcula sp. S1CR25-12]|uniref:NfeD family protein n=1 Tax=Haloarcula saliterrae TaxID=2950534 RepID=A0ABU2F6H7_9EURY|nr:NfeD family protein [Haloarcula sp. S1CR25-12]MDS0257864.1 NfeD family protein [Haloarcula sp. S1CR25-12]